MFVGAIASTCGDLGVAVVRMADGIPVSDSGRSAWSNCCVSLRERRWEWLVPAEAASASAYAYATTASTIKKEHKHTKAIPRLPYARQGGVPRPLEEGRGDGSLALIRIGFVGRAAANSLSAAAAAS